MSSGDIEQPYRRGDRVAENMDRDTGLAVQIEQNTVLSSSKCQVGEEDWETANERIQMALKGGISLTSLDLTSPLISANFVMM